MNKKIIAYIQEKGVLSNTPLFYLSNIFYSISLYSDMASKQGQYFFHFLQSVPQMSLCPMIFASGNCCLSL